MTWQAVDWDDTIFRTKRKSTCIYGELLFELVSMKSQRQRYCCDMGNRGLHHPNFNPCKIHLMSLYHVYLRSEGAHMFPC